MAKTILLIHGRHFKPAKADLKKLWLDALRHAIKRDHPGKLQAFKDAKIELVYFGDLSNAFLKTALGKPVPKDTASRQATLCLLYTSPSPRDLSTSRMPSSA